MRGVVLRLWLVVWVVCAAGLVLPGVGWADQVVPNALKRVFAAGPAGNPLLDIDGVDDRRVDVDVAVFDTGVQLDHPDLNVFRGVDCGDATWPLSGPEFECSSSLPGDGDEDVAGIDHGTGSALSIAALDNGIGTVGMAAGARIWSVDISDEERYGGPAPFPSPLPDPYFDLEKVIAGIRWVTEHADEIEVVHLVALCIPDEQSLPPGSGWPLCGGTTDVDLVAEFEDALADSMAEGVLYVTGARQHHMDAFVPGRFHDLLFSTHMADSDGLPGSLGAGTCNALDDHSSSTSSWGAAVDISSPGCAGSLAVPHVTAAAALLASRDNPDNISDVQAIASTIIAEGNYDWTDTTGDGIKEPLLDVRDHTIFDPDWTYADSTHYVYYRGSNGQLRELVLDDEGAALSASGYAGHMAGDPAVIVDSDGSRYIYYRDTDGRLHEYWELGNEWNHVSHGLANHMAGNPAAAIDPDGRRHVFYRGANGQLNKYTFGSGAPVHIASGYAGHMVGDPAVAVRADGSRYVYYQDSEGRLHEYWERGTNEWNHVSHGSAGHMAGSPDVVVGRTGKRYVYYRGANGQLNKYTFTPDGATHAAMGYADHMVGDPTAKISDDGGRYVFYESSSGRLHQYWERGPNEWDHVDHGANGQVDGGPATTLDSQGARAVFYGASSGELGFFHGDDAGTAISFYGAAGHMVGRADVATAFGWD